MAVKNVLCEGYLLAQLEEHVTPDLGVVSWSPSLGVEITWGGGENVLCGK